MSYVTDRIDKKVVQLHLDGGVGLLPTDTIYGLSCRALDQAAVKKTHALKGRDADKPFIVLIPSLEILNTLSISKTQAQIIGNYWPGPLSVVFDAPAAPAWLTCGSRSLAVRLPDHPQLLQLMSKTGPLISTSANFQGREPAHSVDEAKAIFGDQLDFYVDSGQLDNPPSTLAVIKDGHLKVIRQGAVKIK